MEFGLLGPLTVQRGDRLLAIPLGKPRSVLAVLLVRTGQVVPADELIELIWDNNPPPSARISLQNHVKRLRRALGEPTQARIKTVSPGYQIGTRPDELDLTKFSVLCGEGRRAAARGQWEYATAQLTAALSLWRGQPLLDISCPLLAVSEVPRLEELRASALEDRFDADLHLGRHREVLSELQQFAAGDPLRERAHALLMLALYRAGRRADALVAYQAARRELVRELGLEPGPELRQLHEQILATHDHADLAWADHAPVAGRAAATVHDMVPRQLPTTGAPLVGRQAEYHALNRFLTLGRGGLTYAAGICVVGGSPGIGKTALAVQWAHQVAGQFPHGQLYIDLRGFGPSDPVDPADAVRGFLGALGVPAAEIPPGAPAQAGLYRSLLAVRRMLVLLDNAADDSQVRPLLPASPGSVVVITSRNRLTGLTAAEGARLLTLGPLTQPQARELLAYRLGPQPMASESAAVDDLIRICAGLPLALAAAAADITTKPGLSVADVTREFADAESPLDALDTGDAATSVRTAFSWSCQKLSAPAARLFQQIGAHGGQDITVPCAARLARITKGYARRLLAELTRAHLASEPVYGRFRIHPLLAAYAAEQAHTVLAPPVCGFMPRPALPPSPRGFPQRRAIAAIPLLSLC